MSALIDKTYINYISSRLEKFKWVRQNLCVSRCPFCGDGRRGNRTRFYIYQDVKHSTYLFNVNCKNCGHSESFFNFLKNFDQSLFGQYRMEKFKEKFGREPRNFFSDNLDKIEIGKIVETKTSLELESIPYTLKVSELPDGHSCKEYVKGRMIPNIIWDKLLYTNNFREMVSSFVDEEYSKKMPDDPRLIIPFYSSFGEALCLQGRSLDPNDRIRYITVKKKDSVEKIFGLDRIDRSKEVYVVEGPIDSLFIDNCLASADADLLRVKGDVYIFDSQYRNKDICRHIEKAIEKGVNVVLFPDDMPFKDINDMIVKGGMTREEIKRLIKNNTFSGLKAKQVFLRLKKC